MANKTLRERIQKLEDRSKGVSQRAWARRLRALEEQLRKAREQPSPALALHRAGARTPLFQLECLARLHREIIDDELFLPLHLETKALEDALGAVDFADGLVKKCADNDSELRAYFLGRRAEASAHAQRELSAAGWFGDGEDESEALGEVLDVLDDADFVSEKKERKLVAEYFVEQARSLQKKLEENAFDFTQLEDGVHEVRRKVRWLSILPASLDGLFVRPAHEVPASDALAKYCTPAVVSSPFNKFERSAEVSEPLVFDSPAFLAMSWLINELGSFKDRGQLADAILEAAKELEDGPKAAHARVKKVLGEAPMSHEAIAEAVTPIVEAFTRDKVLSRLAKLA